jgi:hypothetical protein
VLIGAAVTFGTGLLASVRTPPLAPDRTADG